MFNIYYICYFFITLISNILVAIEKREEIVVNKTISSTDNHLTTARNKVSIAIKNKRSLVRPFKNGYIFINLFIYLF
ncbi:MAG: hypothetical protein RSE41_02850 [Clostridia bacterium]